MARIAQGMVVGLGLLLFAAATVYPAIAIGGRVVAADVASPVDISWTLMGRSFRLAASASLLAIVLSLPAAYVVGRCGRRLADAFTVAVLLAPVLLPAMVYAFGWEHVLRVPGEWRCVWVWASWSAPVAALLIGSGWSRLGRRAFEEALLSAGPVRAFCWAVLPILRRHAVVAGLLLFAFFVGEYSVPHACGLIVYATDLLARAEASAEPFEVAFASWPVVVTVALSLLAAAVVWRGAPRIEESGDAALRPAGWRMRAIPLILALTCVVIPVVGLARAVPLGAALAETVETYGAEALGSVGVALAAGMAAVFVGSCLVLWARARMVLLGCMLMFAAMPGALVGEAVLVAYLPVPAVYDSWLLMLFGYLARFGWVGVLVAWLAQASVGREQILAARTDGASSVGTTWRIGLCGNAAMLAGGVFVVTALSLSEVATTALLRVPSVDPVALILIEKFHRFEDGILVSLSLLLVMSALPGAVLAGAAARRWQER